MLMRSTYLMITLLITGCSLTWPSPDYREMQKLPRREWVHFAARLPIERRFDLYEETYEASGHPHDPVLAPAFRTEGQGGLDRTLHRARETSDIVRYLPIIYELDYASELDVCSDSNRNEISKVARESGLDSSLMREISFKSCSL